MKIGQHVRLPDGREATVVFSGLSGVGIKWGRHNPREEDFADTAGNSDDWLWEPDAMLRDTRLESVIGLPCVGEKCELLDD